MAAHGFHLQYVSTRLRPLERTIPVIAAALNSGIDSVQLRDEGPSITAALQRLKLNDLLDRSRVAVNGQAKAAGTYGMDWLHLPASWLENTPPFGRFARIGLSVHSFDDAVEADAIGADYVMFGHIFATQSHPDEDARGLQALAEIVERLDIPVMAIGGITAANLGQVLETGCAGIAVMSAIGDQPNPGAATAQILAAIEASTSRPRVVLPPLVTKKING